MVLVACLLAAACTDAPGATPTGPEEVAPATPPAVASVAIEPATVSLEEGATRELSLAVTAADGTPLDRAAAWRVTDSGVAELSGAGTGRVVKGIKAGSTRVIASVEGLADTATIEVAALVPTVASVELSPSKVSVKEGATGEISLTVTGSDGSELDLEADWSVESPSHAELSGKGKTRKVKGRKSGSTRVIAEVDGVVDTTDVEVTKPEPVGQKAASVRLSSSSISLGEGGTAQLTLQVTAPNGSSLDREGAWRVGDPSVAALKGSGATRTVEAVGAGSTSVIASVDGIADTTQVSVSAASEPPPAPGSVSVTESKVRTSSVRYVADWSASEDADSYRWSAGSDGGGWSASDTGVTGSTAEFEAPRGESGDASSFCVAAVNGDGESEQRCTGFTVPALEQEGSDGGSGSDPDSGTGSDSTSAGSDTTVAKVIVLPDKPSIQVSGTVQLTATAKNASDSTLSASFVWSSLNTGVATVDGSGKVMGKAGGTAGIVAATAGEADTATVTVTASSSGGGGSGGSGGTKIVFDPDLYSSTNELKNDPYGVFDTASELAGPYYLDTQVGYPGGSHSMRYDYVDQGIGRSIHTGRRIPLPSKAKEVWVEFYARWSTNFFAIQNFPQDGSTFAHKLLFGEAKATSTHPNWETSEGWRVERWSLLFPGGGSASPPNASIQAQVPRTYDNQKIVNRIGTNAANYFDGQWHRVRLHWRHDPGLYELSIDGTELYSLTGFTVHPEVDITAILVGRNKDDGIASGTESLWWGKITVWTNDPGW